MVQEEAAGHDGSDSEGSWVVRERRTKPWPVFFKQPRTWKRWAIYRNEERQLWQAFSQRHAQVKLVHFTNLIAPNAPIPPGGIPAIPSGPGNRLRNPWRFARPFPGCPPMRRYTPRTPE